MTTPQFKPPQQVKPSFIAEEVKEKPVSQFSINTSSSAPAQVPSAPVEHPQPNKEVLLKNEIVGRTLTNFEKVLHQNYKTFQTLSRKVHENEENLRAKTVKLNNI